MERYDNQAAQVKPAARNFPEKLTVVRSAHAAASGRVYRAARCFVYTSRGAQVVPPDVGARWRPGEAVPRAEESASNALGALLRNAQATERPAQARADRRRAA